MKIGVKTMGRYFGIFLSTMILVTVLFFLLGAFGMADYIDGIVMTVGLIITIQLSIIISLLVYIIDLLKKRN
jgi:hypothetical protein